VIGPGAADLVEDLVLVEGALWEAIISGDGVAEGALVEIRTRHIR
jgi:hypothetical protein